MIERNIFSYSMTVSSSPHYISTIPFEINTSLEKTLLPLRPKNHQVSHITTARNFYYKDLLLENQLPNAHTLKFTDQIEGIVEFQAKGYQRILEPTTTDLISFLVEDY